MRHKRDSLSSANRITLLITVAGVVLFSVMFIFKKTDWFGFWYWMSANLIILLSFVFYTDSQNLKLLVNDFKENLVKKAILGLVFALILFMIFYFGNYLLGILYSGAGVEIKRVYDFKQNASDLRILILMLLIIGPGEELFWRGFVQRRLEIKKGKKSGLVLATALYTVVHIFTGNIILLIAALTCGIFWGWLYQKYRSMIINMISHSLWDVMVFIILPFG
ncbi:MAG TPA: type II CAAX endopeptidase family protein [Bacteroidales bacterium]|jgi:membrane protease YdiL (CAAX protease family)|nr:CPBP family intramembrane metalloprotease [Bacteroidales bacterium]NLH32991.1 CPBP family intramembrane metalloprotease [Lentimicrobium sp.]OQC38307.1 MAG: CAAX amino terminal protease self- immunity [Bacteroidetes bacterium ADurb.Bin041]MBP7873417.1 CPBP family intramembrane metalloprotease [Bacteroidales bacterium]MCZ2281628.1 CPBP family intramembrane metalloprotease [Bacteroidales bacterium]